MMYVMKKLLEYLFMKRNRGVGRRGSHGSGCEELRVDDL